MFYVAVVLAVITVVAAIFYERRHGRLPIGQTRHRFGFRLAEPTFVIVDIDSGTPLAELQSTAAAIEAQVREDWSPLWGTSARVRAATPDAPAQPGEIRIEYRKTPTADEAGALADHDVDDYGQPFCHVFPTLCREEGDAPSSACSHEVLETLGDPFCRRLSQLPDGRLVAVEVCDQVQADTYEKLGVRVANFNTPQNFEPPKNTAGVKFDFLGLCRAWFEVRSGGYAQVYQPGKGWTQLGELKGYRARLAKLGLGRGKRRAA